MAKLTQPTWRLGAATASVAESAGNLNLTVTLSAASPVTITVNYATANGTASAGSDYLAQGGTLTFVPGVTTQPISIPIVGDPNDEPNETFTVTLTGPYGARLGTIPATTVTITDDDAAPTVSWQGPTTNVGEAAGTALVPVVLSAPSAFTISVAYATSPGTATAGSDYTTRSGTLTFAPSQTALNISIPITNDATAEPNETVNLTLSSPTNASIGGTNPATLTIIDNDGGSSGSDEYYQYDALGDLLQKGATAYAYGATAAGCVAGTPASKPHAATSAGAASYAYDCDGNMLSGSTRTSMLWDTENRLTSVTNGGLTETYGYDADGERITRTTAGVTTVYLGGLWEETSAGAVKQYYSFNGTVVAVRDSGAGVSYLHADHLGSVSATSGTQAGNQTFGPWGNVTSGSTSATSMNYTGQRLDSASGLLYYHARYYDATLARFISADSVVPGAGALTVAPSDATALATWTAGGGGPLNPQELNRYSYVNNNPLTYNDPSGHCSGGSTWNNFVSVFNGTCFQRGMTIMAHAKNPGDWALGAFAAAGPSAAIAMLIAGTFGLGAVAIEGTGLTTAGAIGAAAEVAGNTAYEAAKEGGRNAGLLRTYSTRSLAQIEKGMNSLQKGAALHLNKIADPTRYAERWNTMSEQEQEGLLRYWQKEVVRYAQQAEVLRGLLKEKQGGS